MTTKRQDREYCELWDKWQKACNERDGLAEELMRLHDAYGTEAPNESLRESIEIAKARRAVCEAVGGIAHGLPGPDWCKQAEADGRDDLTGELRQFYSALDAWKKAEADK